ncbi:MAG: Eco57I restriction-modification methylase domain-containing protein [Mycoplasmataceae bacterium]|nr:Eco57I restriction-modification methylase domain-containing protein [Mycoplasmataceae bacterium]
MKAYKPFCKEEIYKKFSDGLEFVPDIGRGASLGEIFTPKVVVEKMLKFLNIDKVKSNATILEPASGHGNFAVEIINYKFKKVISEMKKENLILKNANFIKEYEIRTLLALGSMYLNDIDYQNIERIKERCYKFILSLYKKYTKTKSIPEHYANAVNIILLLNTLHGDFISKNTDFNFVLYFRKNDNIIRLVKKFSSILNPVKQETLFSDEYIEQPIYDIIPYNHWVFTINGYNTLNNNFEAMEAFKNQNKYDKVAKEIIEKFHFDKGFKFDYCISNPPYQKIVGEGPNADQAIPLYDKFFNLSLSL